MKKKKIILIKHGEYRNTPPFDLSEDGKNDICKLAIEIMPEIRGKEMLCITSMIRYARQSTQILQEIWQKNGISVVFEERYEVWSGTDARDELSEGEKIVFYDSIWFKNFLETTHQEVIIIVTHKKFVEDFLNSLEFPNRSIKNGQAIIADLKIKEHDVV
ncbi:MAG: hypothetical protein WC010_02510 [Candidatus Absconditabacterales bacterium]